MYTELFSKVALPWPLQVGGVVSRTILPLWIWLRAIRRLGCVLFPLPNRSLVRMLYLYIPRVWRCFRRRHGSVRITLRVWDHRREVLFHIGITGWWFWLVILKKKRNVNNENMKKAENVCGTKRRGGTVGSWPADFRPEGGTIPQAFPFNIPSLASSGFDGWILFQKVNLSFHRKFR